MATQIVIAKELGFGSEQPRDTARGLCEEVGKMLVAMMKQLRK
jgi:hypothetical protein